MNMDINMIVPALVTTANMITLGYVLLAFLGIFVAAKLLAKTKLVKLLARTRFIRGIRRFFGIGKRTICKDDHSEAKWVPVRGLKLKMNRRPAGFGVLAKKPKRFPTLTERERFKKAVFMMTVISVARTPLEKQSEPVLAQQKNAYIPSA